MKTIVKKQWLIGNWLICIIIKLMKDIINEESLMKFNERMAGLLKEEFIGGREFARLRKYCYRKKEKAILVNKTKSLNIVLKSLNFGNIFQ